MIRILSDQKTIDYKQLGLMLLLAMVGLGSGLWARDILLDDAMITFRVAENLAQGRGFVYNVGERVQVTTTPLYAMVVAIGSWIAGGAPQAALGLNIALAAIIPVLAYDVGRRLAGWITGLTGALLLSFAPLLVIAFSMESYLYVALILAAIDAYLARHYGLAGILAGITALTRGDAVLMGAAILIYDFLAHRRLHWQLILPAVTIPATWYLFSTLYYGSPFPATLEAKTAQGQLNWLGDYFISGFLEYWEDWIEDYSWRFWLFPLLYLIGLTVALWREPRWRILILRDLLYIATFEGLGVTFAEWYYAPLMPGLALLTGRGVQAIADGSGYLLARFRSDQPAAGRLRFAATSGVALGLILLLGWTQYPVTADIVAQNPNWKAQAYPDAARWIARHTNASARLATIDIGHLGYWSGRPIIDIVGLAQPDVAAHIAEGDFGYAIRQYQPEMVLIGASWLPEIQREPWFQQAYPPRHNFHLSGMDEPLTLFTRQQGVKVQPEAVPPSQIQPLTVDFNRQASLTGYHLNRPLPPGGVLNVTLIWQAVAPIDVDFTVFVQVIDAENNVLAQGDSKPQGGFYGTPYWQPGEQIIDLHPVFIPEDIQPGSYDLLVGFYEADSGARLQILDEDGTFKADHVSLPGVEIRPLH